MRSLWFGVLVCATMFVACGDDDSDFAARPSGGSLLSSSSAKSSGSVSLATPCKTETEDNCEYGELVDNRDGQTYKTVKIGNQWWMAENLNFETDSSFCHNNVESNCAKYGRLYIWAAAMLACPDGWHLPTQTEWNTLFTAVGGSSVAGRKLKSTSGWNSNGNGTDAFGFSALPAAFRNNYGDFGGEGYNAYFWSSTELDSYGAYYMYLCYDYGTALLNDHIKDNGFIVRCLKD